ncbi:MAG TPA: sn-glycerol-3-phosphate ABC transporter ATP-binding protein UgpC [Bdellovibrionota bacterium]|nr:sn-glycerol-3-phosphate ABC transporter ATP-binding protein UgpC [Bdellovibrionota bacterium]
MASLVLKNLCKDYSDVRTVHGIDLEIHDREFVVFVGPSGCGKSTTLRMIAGLETISEGSISIDKKVVNDIPPKDRDIAMVFQNYALYPHMSVYENLAFALKLRKFPQAEIDKKIQEASRILGIQDYLSRKPGALSGGQRQRVAMGRAIVRNPKLFLFDEPLSNLDAKLRNQMRVEIKKLHKQLGATTIYVTHDQVEAMTLADRIVIMKDGRIEQVGTPLEVYRKPANIFVANFIGNPPMNILNAEVRSGKLHSGIAGIDEALALPEIVQSAERVYVGVRPEDISLALGAVPAGHISWEAPLELFEPLGATELVYMTIGEQRLIGQIASTDKLEVGQNIKVSAPREAFNFFDVASGKRLEVGKSSKSGVA